MHRSEVHQKVQVQTLPPIVQTGTTAAGKAPHIDGVYLIVHRSDAMTPLGLKAATITKRPN